MRNRLISLALLIALPIASPLGAQDKTVPRIPAVEDAPIAYLIDAGSGQILYEREIDRRFMPASITKVMTTFLAFEWMEEGRLFPQQVFGVRPGTFREWNRKGSTMFLPADARITVDDLLHGITTVSANDGAVVLAEGAAGSVGDWVVAMNARARDIGMSNSHFGNPNGWMDDGKTFVTARDLGTLAQAMVARHPSKYRHFIGAAGLKYNGIEQRNHDPISGVVAGADGIKTGFTNQAGYGFLGSAQRNGQRLVMVVAGSPDGRARNRASREFIEWGFQNFESRVLFADGERIAGADVQEGGATEVGLVVPGGVRIAIPRGSDPQVSLSLRYEGPLQAPVAKGEEVAELIVSIEGMPEHRVPLVAGEEVLEATMLQRVFNAFRSWVT
ncbi:D-alanyl-D-alanine carboxypeptidase family protein [Qipengyuania qiaonensis]|uniref:serine-type D-Ala-D-Ala carboxypeptidase n=1 Tax=Qipengyuania qiaonensis TaxID=2867240 RepID=A0ABS7J8E8_9SPHN|nr:D-alanyl-D-alanine carboxypeptidase family protein [Qipengyuania qiaonensis]MBX7481257.1 D-alanyl-D-alanine carboxypeptidase [Qipengyuania qiaonensis]